MLRPLRRKSTVPGWAARPTPTPLAVAVVAKGAAERSRRPWPCAAPGKACDPAVVAPRGVVPAHSVGHRGRSDPALRNRRKPAVPGSPGHSVGGGQDAAARIPGRSIPQCDAACPSMDMTSGPRSTKSTPLRAAEQPPGSGRRGLRHTGECTGSRRRSRPTGMALGTACMTRTVTVPQRVPLRCSRVSPSSRPTARANIPKHKRCLRQAASPSKCQLTKNSLIRPQRGHSCANHGAWPLALDQPPQPSLEVKKRTASAREVVSDRSGRRQSA